MSKPNKLDITQIFNRLEPFYILIFIHDIQEFNLQDLHGLVIALQANKNLDERHQSIHKKLIQLSEQNVKEKKMKKKKKNNNQKQASSFAKSQNSTFLSDIPLKQPYGIDQSGYDFDQINNQPRDVLAKFTGIIYDGRLTIILPVKYKANSVENISFEIRGQQKKSSISLATLQKFKIPIKGDHTILHVAQRMQEFQVYGSNILGLDFLSNNKVVLECNYRSEINKFTVSFTA